METNIMDLIQAVTPRSATIDASDHEQIAALLATLHSDDYKGCKVSALNMLPKISYAVRYYLELGEEFRTDSPAEASLSEAKRIYLHMQNIYSLLTDRYAVEEGCTMQTALANEMKHILKHVFSICELHDIDIFAELQDSLIKSADDYQFRGSESLEPKQDTVKKPTI